MLKRVVAIISFWRWIWSREIPPEAPAGGGSGARSEPGFPVRALFERDILPPPKPYSKPFRGFSFRALMARETLPPPTGHRRSAPEFSFRTLMARETLPPPRPEHPGRKRSLLGFLIAREFLPRLMPDPGCEPIIEHRE